MHLYTNVTNHRLEGSFRLVYQTPSDPTSVALLDDNCRLLKTTFDPLSRSLTWSFVQLPGQLITSTVLKRNGLLLSLVADTSLALRIISLEQFTMKDVPVDFPRSGYKVLAQGPYGKALLVSDDGLVILWEVLEEGLSHCIPSLDYQYLSFCFVLFCFCKVLQQSFRQWSAMQQQVADRIRLVLYSNAASSESTVIDPALVTPTLTLTPPMWTCFSLLFRTFMFTQATAMD